MPSWSLADADELAREHKYTFYKPSPALIARLRPGDVVKLIFEFDSDDPESPAAERMWVLIDEIGADGGFEGRLNNNPYYIKDLKLDDPVGFRACHVIDTQLEDGSGDALERFTMRCYTTARILRDGQPVGYLFREEPNRDDDSGWAIMAGDETDDYLDDEGNRAYVSLGAVLNRDDSILHLLDAPAGSAFVRDEETGGFVPDEGDGD